MNTISVEEINQIIQDTIAEWHATAKDRRPDYEMVTDDMRKIKPLNCHREDLRQVIQELIIINTEMWHEEDKVRSADDQVVLRAIRNLNPLNQHRNDLIEEIDEIITSQR